MFGSKPASKSEIETRRQERKRSKRRIIGYRISVAVAAIGLILGIVWVGWFSPLFAVNDGAVQVTAEGGELELSTVTQIAEQQVGQPLPRLDVKGIETAILKDKAIGSVRVTRDWPRGLTVTVSPRVPSFVLQDGGKSQLVGSDGVVIREVEEAPPGTFVVELGSKKTLSEGQTEEIRQFWDQLAPTVQERVAVVRVSGDQFMLEMQGGSQVFWGENQDTGAKNEVLSLLMTQRPSSIYDVANPLKPSVR